MNRIYLYIQRYIQEDFTIFDLDNYIARRCNIHDFIRKIVILYNIQNRDFQFSNQEYTELTNNPYDLDLICQSFCEKIISIFDIKFKNDLYEIISSGKEFPHKDFTDMQFRIEERRI